MQCRALQHPAPPASRPAENRPAGGLGGIRGLAVATLFACAAPAAADQALVAVAANFAEPMETLAPLFSARTGHTLKLVTASTGQLYAQIQLGAPFDVLLAADELRPRRLVAAGQALSDGVFVYARGRLVLWSPDANIVATDGATTLRAGQFRFLAIANPELAPYGAAARETLEKLGVWQDLKSRTVRGQNVGQAFQMVASGNAELGLVPLSYVLSNRNPNPGSRWLVPSKLHAPIHQAAALLQHGADNAAARQFVAFLRTAEARRGIQSFGYAVDEP